MGPASLSDVLVIGECVATWLADGAANIGCTHDFLLLNNYSILPISPPRPVTTYDFQLVQIPLRSVLPEWEYLALPFDQVSQWQQLYQDSCDRLTQVFKEAVRYNEESDLLTFVAGFLVPQQNPMGRLLPRNDARNLVFVVESLNRQLATLVESCRNAYYVDFDQIASGLGKQFIQDDSLDASAHGAMLGDSDPLRDTGRLEPPGQLSDHFDIRTDAFRSAVWMELLAMYRTVRRVDEVKMVIVDLDDTLWRGVVGEADDVADDTIEGWPMGIIEALQFLKKRGILLGIISKNDEARIAALWPTIFRGRLRLDDFAVRKINWRPKADNLEEILAEVNLLSRSVLFVDDNPAERESIRAAFPDVRVLGARLYQLKRALLWAPETQVPFISHESAHRTQMVQGQISRERERKMVPRQQFLANLGIEVGIFAVRQHETTRVSRSIELLNKTNQFNTTGRRWTDEDVRTLFGNGGSIFGFEVRDKFTDYGTVGVIVLRPSAEGRLLIEQVVMSCRVFGLDVEQAVMLAVLERKMQSGERSFSGVIQKLSTNQPSWDLFLRLGFSETDDGVWSVDGVTDRSQPSSVSVRWEK